jgi:catechol 2,3-dioxygenase-like lactoylglutathione lyase family enzyme
MTIRQIKETCIYSRDLEAARIFYHERLGFEIISYLPGKHIFFKVGISVLLCFNPDDSREKKSPPPHYSTGRYHFAFEVAAEDYEQQKAEIISKGIPIVDTVVWDSGSRAGEGSAKATLESFYFEDGLGNILEIVPVGIW